MCIRDRMRHTLTDLRRASRAVTQRENELPFGPRSPTAATFVRKRSEALADVIGQRARGLVRRSELRMSGVYLAAFFLAPFGDRHRSLDQDAHLPPALVEAGKYGDRFEAAAVQISVDEVPVLILDETPKLERRTDLLCERSHDRKVRDHVAAPVLHENRDMEGLAVSYTHLTLPTILRV